MHLLYQCLGRVEAPLTAQALEKLKAQLAGEDTSPMVYNSPKAKEITEEDKLVVKFPLGLKPQDIKVTPVSEVFQ